MYGKYSNLSLFIMFSETLIEPSNDLKKSRRY